MDVADLRILIERIVRRRELLESIGSPLGYQLEALREADDTVQSGPRAAERIGSAWARKAAADARHAEFAYLATLAKLLSPEELQVLEVRDIPATPDELGNRNPPETNERERVVWRGDVLHERTEGGQSIQHRTRAGEVVVHDCGGEPDRCDREPPPEIGSARARDDGRWCMRDPARVTVRGIVAKFPTTREVAARCGLSERQVRHRIESAYMKLRDDLVRRGMKEVG